MRRPLVMMIGLGATCLSGQAIFASRVEAQTQPHTLQEAFAAAYSTNPTLLAARAALRAVDEGVPQALSGWRPQVVFSTSTGYADGNVRTFQAGSMGTPGQGVITRANQDSFAATATVSQPIYQGGKTVATTHSAENKVFSERGRLIATEQLVFTNVVTDFVNVIQDQQLLALDVNNELVLTRQLQATNDRFRVGEITRTDVAQAEAALAGARATRQTAEGTLQTADAAYQRDVGFLPEHLVEPQPLALPIKSSAQAEQLAAANNPQVIFTMFDQAASKDAVDLAYSGLMPTVTAQASTFHENNPSFGIRQRIIGAQASVNASAPIYQGGAEYAAIRQAKQTEDQARKTVDDTRRQVIQAALSSWETFIAARSTVDSTRSAIRANEIALEGTQREAIVGSRTTLDVLNAEQALLQSRSTLVQNLASVVLSSYQVASAIGRLTARDLHLNVPLYDDQAYYKAVRDRLFGTGDYALSQPGR